MLINMLGHNVGENIGDQLLVILCGGNFITIRSYVQLKYCFNMTSKWER